MSQIELDFDAGSMSELREGPRQLAPGVKDVADLEAVAKFQNRLNWQNVLYSSRQSVIHFTLKLMRCSARFHTAGPMSRCLYPEARSLAGT